MMNTRSSRLLATSVVSACVATSPARAQQRPQPADSIVTLDAVVVTAERAETPLAASVASVSRLSAAQLARVPQLTFADALRQVPGFAVVSFDGLGYDPQLMTRGFYGGGEAEYVVVMIDGKPVNNVQAGGIAWDALPLGAAESIEIVRGGASALYGDAALAGIINIITRTPRANTAGFGVSGGTFNTFRFDAEARTELFDRGVNAWAGGELTDGFRDHARREAWRAGGNIPLVARERSTLTLSGMGHWRDLQDPGPLLGTSVAEDRTAANPFYRFDSTEDLNLRLGLDLDHELSAASRLSGSLTGEHRSTDALRTLAIAPQFADTKLRELRTQRAAATAQLSLDDTPVPVTDRLIVGVDASYGWLDSKYYNVVTGPLAAYDASTGARGTLDTSGDGKRAAIAAFVNYSISPVAAVRLSLGARADWLRDTFDPSEPPDTSIETTHDAISPKAGINVQYIRSSTHTGHVYASAGRSFKAATLDQLFDMRRIPVAPGVSITTSNPELAPQRGTSIEAGLYHGATLVPGSLVAELSLSAYHMKMKDELDFDVQTYRYINIGRSKHRGIEAGLRINGPQRTSAFINYTLQRVTAEIGPNAGKFLKAIPRNSLSGGLSLFPIGELELGAIASHARDIFLDDANTLTLPDYTRVDTRLSYGISGARVYLDIRNVLDEEYSSSGFPDPSGQPAVYYYPAARRTFEVGVRTRR